MAELSNFLWGRQPSAAGEVPAVPLSCRLVQTAEQDAALRLLLAGSSGLATREQILDFMAFAHDRGVDATGIWVATRGSQIEWALLPILSPGKTMLLISPTRLLHSTAAASAMTLTRLVLDHFKTAGVQLAQLLLDPQRPDVRDVYRTAGFDELAELLYLARTVKRALDPPAWADRYSLKTYSTDTEPLFAQAIRHSYDGSLDCPGLNGLRDMVDVIEGHKSAGDFDPSLWFVLLDHGTDQTLGSPTPIGALLLTRSSAGTAIELIYLGLAKVARGQGLGDKLVQLALATVSTESRSELTLAVDAKNSPAVNLYYRHGLKRVASRLAMLADLRR